MTWQIFGRPEGAPQDVLREVEVNFHITDINCCLYLILQ